MVLRKCLERGAGWHDDSQAEARQLEGIGPVLGQRLRDDGLVADETDDEEAFRLAQFDALNSFGARRSEVWVALADGHPWSG